MNLSDNGFLSTDNLVDSPVGSPVNFFVTGPLQVQETGFHPTFDLSLMHQGDAPKDDDLDEEPKPLIDELDQKIADAYTQGYLTGQQAAIVQSDEIEQGNDALAVAINRLQIIDESRFAKQLWETALSLFQEAAGNARINKRLLQQRCDEAVELIGAELGEACLHVATGDAEILKGYDCGIPIIAMPELLPGSVHLHYASGEIISGSMAVVKEIESRIGLAGGKPC